MIPYSLLVHCTGGLLVLLNAKGASKLAERAPEPAEGLIDSWEAEVFREKLGTIPELLPVKLSPKFWKISHD